jgi:mannose/fructose/N-acetylgalactosamine-specific phosphotransferase system component IIC
MLGRPLVTGLFMGLALGRPWAGLTLGLWTEILWLSRPPLGGFISPNGGLAVSCALLASTLLARFFPLAPERPVLVLLFALIPPLAKMATGLEVLGREVAGRREERLELLESLPPPGPEPVFFWANLKGLLFTLLAALAGLTAGTGLVTLGAGLVIRLDPQWLWPLLDKLAPLIPLVGLSINAGRLPKSLFAYYFLGLAAALALLSLA